MAGGTPESVHVADLYGTRPIGPLRDRIVVDIGSEDYEPGGGFVCQAAAAGDLDFRTWAGQADQSVAGMSVGDAVEVAGVPVLLSAVRGTSTVTRIVVGRL